MASDMRLELIQVPVSDIDRAKTFYVEKVGFKPTMTTRSPTSFDSCS